MFGSTPEKKIAKLEAKKAKYQDLITAIDTEIAKLKASVPPATPPQQPVVPTIAPAPAPMPVAPPKP